MLRVLILIIYFGVSAGCGCGRNNQVYIQHRAPITGWYTHIPSEEAFEMVVGEVDRKVVSYKLVYLKDKRMWSLIHIRSPKVTNVFTWNATSGSGEDVENVKIFCPGRCECRQVYVKGPWCMHGNYGRFDVVEHLKEERDKAINKTLQDAVDKLKEDRNKSIDETRQKESPLNNELSTFPNKETGFQMQDDSASNIPILDNALMNLPKQSDEPFLFSLLPMNSDDDYPVENDNLERRKRMSDADVKFLGNLGTMNDNEYPENDWDDANYEYLMILEPLPNRSFLNETIAKLDELASCVSEPSTSPTGFCAAGTRPAPLEVEVEVSLQDNDTELNDGQDEECFPDEYIFMDQAIYQGFKISRGQGHLWWIGINDQLYAVSDEGAPCLDQLPDYTQWLTVSEDGTLEPNSNVSVRCVQRDPP